MPGISRSVPYAFLRLHACVHVEKIYTYIYPCHALFICNDSYLFSNTKINYLQISPMDPWFIYKIPMSKMALCQLTKKVGIYLHSP